MHTALYVIWFLCPTFFFVLALWAKLEQMSGSVKKHDPISLFRQGVFLLICVLIACLVDTYVLEGMVASLSPDFIPLGFYQIMLLPVILVIGAQVIGPSSTLLIGAKKEGSRRTSTRKRR
jgi:uncharacterized membrane protein